MSCKNCSCGLKEREVAAAKAKKENLDRIILYDVDEESGCGSCASSSPLAEGHRGPTTPAPKIPITKEPISAVNHAPSVDSNANSSWTYVSGLDVITVKVKETEGFFALPEYKTSGSVGMDLYCAEDIFAPIS